MAKQKKHMATAGEVLDRLQELVNEHGRETEFALTIPYRNGLGFHYEYAINICHASGLIDMHVTTPQDDDMEKVKH